MRRCSDAHYKARCCAGATAKAQALRRYSRPTGICRPLGRHPIIGMKPPTKGRASELTEIKSPIESFDLARLLEDGINPLTTWVTGGRLDLSMSPPGTSHAGYAALIFNGKLTANQTIMLPDRTKWWLVQNATSGAFTLNVKTPLGALSTAIPQNSDWQIVYCDGNNNIVVSSQRTLQTGVRARKWIGDCCRSG